MRRTSYIAALLAVLLGLAGCQATGGGWLASDVLTDKATFAFNFTVTSISGEPLQGDLAGSYHDPQGRSALGAVEVDFKGTGHLRRSAPPANLPPDTLCLAGPAQYQSQNKALPGSGHLNLLMCDLGEPGASSGDYLNIDVIDGPYMGYFKQGAIQSGNIQAK